MLKRWNLSLVDVALVIVLVAVAAVIILLQQSNADAERERATLMTRVAAAELNLSPADREASLESLRQSLAQAQSAPTDNLFPSGVEAVAVSSEIMRYAEEGGIAITRWDSSYTSVSVAERSYPVLSHSLSAEGGADALINFIEALSSVSVTPIVKTLDIAIIEGTANKWTMNLDLLIYYH